MKFSLSLILVLILLCVTEARDPYKRRELKGGRSGGGRSSYRGGARGSITYARSNYKVTNGVYKYSTVKNTPTRTNNYYDGK